MATFEDPLNLVICGVGGQGNVLASRIIARALTHKGYSVTIGETYGAAQRGGAVMSHVRVSRKKSYGPFVPKGRAHVILSLEPMETLRMLRDYGNPEVLTITNFHPLFPTGVIMGQVKYPDFDELEKAIRELSQAAWFLDATKMSVELGAPVVANVIMIGALIGADRIPLRVQDMEDAIRDSFSPSRVELNLKAFQMGLDSVRNGG